MKRLTMGGMAAVAMLVTTSAQAMTGVLDFKGFTITYEGTGQWDQAPTSVESTKLLLSGRYDAATDVFTDNGKGVRTYNADVTFGSSMPIEVASYGGLGNKSFESRFSYTIQPKNGWVLEYGEAQHNQFGSFVQQNGGVAAVGQTADVTWTGGRWFPGWSSSTGPDSSTQGYWWTSELRSVIGDSHQARVQDTFDANGNRTGYVVEHTYLWGPPALTGMNGSFSQTLSAVTNGPGQTASLDVLSAGLTFKVTAVQNIAPVPEPESYAMLAAGFGAMGFLARRKAKRTA